jgi:alpha-galactosidase
VTQVYRINPDHLPFWRWNVPGAYPPGGQGTGDLIDRMADPAVAAGLAPYAFPDPDFLMTGLFQTPAESRTEFSFWALWSAPMLVATDVRNMTADKLAILTNADVLGVQRDPLLAPAARLRLDNATGAQVWAKPLASGGAAVILFNAGDVAPVDVAVSWAELGPAWAGAGVTVRVYDAWAHAVVAPAQAGGATAAGLGPHASVMWLLSRN